MQLGLSENFEHFNHCHQTDISESIVSIVDCKYNRVDQLLDSIHVFSASVFHILCGFHRFTLAGKTHEPRTTSPTRGRSVPPRWLSECMAFCLTFSGSCHPISVSYCCC